MKKLFVLAVASLVVSTPAFAGDDMSKMNDMMSEMMNCAVCKHMAPHMEKFAPVMSMEVITLNDGTAILHNISDPEVVPLFHAIGAEMAAAGAKIIEMTDEEAKTGLCHYCQTARKLMMAGARMHLGDTKTGDIMAYTSDDPKVQVQIAAMETEAREMCAMMQGNSEG